MFPSPYPDVEIPEVSIYDHLFGSLSEEDFKRVAFIDPDSGAPTSYGQLRDDVDALAGALAARGIREGTVVGLLSPNVPAFGTVFHAVLRAGGTVTPLNALYTAPEIEKQLRDAGATVLFTVAPLLDNAEGAAAAVGIGADRLILMDGAPGYPGLSDLLAEARTAPRVVCGFGTSWTPVSRHRGQQGW